MADCAPGIAGLAALDDLTSDEFEQVLELDLAGDPAARRFRRWVTGTVLPAIRRGGYRERTPGEAADEIARIRARLRAQ